VVTEVYIICFDLLYQFKAVLSINVYFRLFDCVMFRGLYTIT